MFRLAHVIDGVVDNITICDESSAQSQFPETILIPENLSVQIGWEYIDGEFIDPSPSVDLPSFPREDRWVHQ